MNCCRARAGIEEQFGADAARDELERYRRDGLRPTTRALIDAIRGESAGVQGGDVLDIGGGVGGASHALLERGAARAVHVDLSPAFLDAAREEAGRRGLADRIRFVDADFVAAADGVPSADVVILDRVICCYPEMELLVERSAERARRIWGAVYPRDRWPIRAAARLANAWLTLRRSSFRVFVHSPRAIDATLRMAGLERGRVQRTWVWEVVVYERRGLRS